MFKDDYPTFEAKYKNIARLNVWINEIIPANFVFQLQREKKMFENVSQLTSSADFIKAVKASDIAEAQRILQINVKPIGTNG